jgi:histidinol dehydrogenase
LRKTPKVAVETVKELLAGKKRPIQKLVLYIPGGTAPLFSTVLMLAVPNIAGCKEIILCSPSDKTEKLIQLFCTPLIYVVLLKY